MPAREEFEYEFDQEAEVITKDMVFDELDTPEEIGTLFWRLHHVN